MGRRHAVRWVKPDIATPPWILLAKYLIGFLCLRPHVRLLVAYEFGGLQRESGCRGGLQREQPCSQPLSPCLLPPFLGILFTTTIIIIAFRGRCSRR